MSGSEGKDMGVILEHWHGFRELLLFLLACLFVWWWWWGGAVVLTGTCNRSTRAFLIPKEAATP